MNTTTATVELPRPRRRAPRRPRLVNAELLKLRKRRGLVLVTFALTVLPMVAAYIVLMVLHATERLAPSALFDGSPTVTMSASVAIAVLAAWTVVPLAVGAWRTLTREA